MSELPCKLKSVTLGPLKVAPATSFGSPFPGPSYNQPLSLPLRPPHVKDNGEACINFGQDPVPNLKRLGYCIVRKVFSRAECHATISAIWNWLESLGTGIDRNVPETWSDDKWPSNINEGMIQHSLGYKPFMWYIREHPNMIELFRQIYQTRELMVSLDGASIVRPGKTGSPISWLHTDQNPTKSSPDLIYGNPECSVQGIANFEMCGDDDASLLVGKGSHMLHPEVFKRNGKNPENNWYRLDKDDLDFLTEKGVEWVKLNPEEGSVILFLSTVWHSGKAHKEQQINHTESLTVATAGRFRYVTYVSYAPASRATPEDLEIKARAVREGKLTTHWGSNNVRIFPSQIPNEEHIDYENWSDFRKQLVGLIPY